MNSDSSKPAKDQTKTQIKERFFLSLKWKVVLLFSLVLFIINAGLAGMGYLQQSKLFDTYQGRILQQHSRQVKSLLDASFFRLEQIALMIPVLSEVATASDDLTLGEKLERFFQHSEATLEIDWGLEEAAYYNQDNLLQFNWQAGELDDSFAELIDAVNRLEVPLTKLYCDVRCRQYVAVPLLDKGKHAGVILLGRSLADVIIEFKELAKTDVAIINRPKDPEKLSGRNRFLIEWQRYIAGSSNLSQLIPLLQSTASKMELNQLLESKYTTIWNGEHYALSLIPASSDATTVAADFVIASNITPVVNQIKQATTQSIIIGIIGFAVSELLLALFLWQPMKRLLMISDSLPLLAKNAFHEVRSKLSLKHRDWYQDEIDIASDSAIQLTHTLEHLHNEIKTNTENLIKRSKELAVERDFLNTIMESAQVIILTQDCNGAILTINPEGGEFIGIRNYEPGTRHFCDLFMNVNDIKEMKHVMLRLRDQMINSYQHDASALSSDGQKKTISWVHSPLAGKQDPNETVILSVGLDITDREVAEERLAWLAKHDPLTELYNRRNFQTEFDKIVTFAERYHHDTALLFFDLDQFKYINDASGHQAGDALLQIVARKLREVTRSTDLLARLGGDEFAIVIPETGIQGATQFADKLLSELKQITIPLRGHSHRISASIGIVTYPKHGITSEELLSNADLAMYQAKESGRDQWHIFSSREQVREEMSNRVTWKDKIEQALAENRFVLHYQPIMEIANGEITHYEVLIRMVESDGTLAMPGKFIPVAERTGLIHQINRYVLATSIQQLASMNQEAQNITLSINLSGRVVEDPELLSQLTRLLNSSGINPERLVFELTETAALADVNAAVDLMSELQALGCHFALDDFGVGFSSFYYLRELPLDIVKIDGSFIKNLTTNTKDQVFVKALTQMANALGKVTVAEFVEDEPTLKLLKEIGVAYAQGYHIGRPSPEIPVVAKLNSSITL
ncbi:MAG: EAL domain-containing protein [Candidatus Thiodiazotropha sp. (ex Ctena orbiculata)]|nr:EAL domain-containing protein [Candidatus Thiodiazotropha taylori]MBT2997898.1 EAL domain-containing protein [Candidatus Thiodiazotropha taylori]MBT3001686.1 EAL domain-containing protein [Candidatus Thiodiazotropha taylori]MBV2107543.1 EAL domain-containing protein [Candidatus Thiodiazotropha taylori]MBV2112403.1 EAL domain-containing protein [Candidatus Thiodiazotropha taylori]